MEIIIGKNAGFCYGVKNAVVNTEEQLKENKNIYCLGELVHNRQVVEKLENSGLKIVDKLADSKNKIIIRAHGTEKKTYEDAKKMNIEILDYTCPNVLKIHNIAKEFASKGYYIFLIGEKKHPETIGNISFCGENSFLIENENEIKEAINNFENSKLNKLLIITQTTFSLEKFNLYVDIIKNNLNENVELVVKNTICNATKIRQEETEQISKKVDFMIIVGGKNSSNTKKLFQIAKTNCKNSIIIETKEELNLEDIKNYKTIGIMAGASTPDYIIEDIYNTISNYIN